MKIAQRAASYMKQYMEIGMKTALMTSLAALLAGSVAFAGSDLLETQPQAKDGLSAADVSSRAAGDTEQEFKQDVDSEPVRNLDDDQAVEVNTNVEPAVEGVAQGSEDTAERDGETVSQ